MDVIPAGHISLRHAFDRFRRTLWRGEDPLGTLHGAIVVSGHPDAGAACQELQSISDEILSAFVRTLKTRQITARARHPERVGRYAEITPEVLSEVNFPERLLMDDKIRKGHSPYLNNLVGRTPFIKIAELEGLVKQLLPEAAVHRKSVAKIFAGGVLDDLPAGLKARLLESFSVQIGGYNRDGGAKVSKRRPGRRAILAALLKEKYPDGPLGISDKALIKELEELAPRFKPISLSTFSRAMKLAYPEQSS